MLDIDHLTKPLIPSRSLREFAVGLLLVAGVIVLAAAGCGSVSPAAVDEAGKAGAGGASGGSAAGMAGAGGTPETGGAAGGLQIGPDGADDAGDAGPTWVCDPIPVFVYDGGTACSGSDGGPCDGGAWVLSRNGAHTCLHL